EVAVGERRADRGRRAVADAVAARAAEPLVVLLDRPEAVQPIADVARLRNDRPVGVFHRVVGLDREARGADRARVPRERRRLLAARFVLGVRLLRRFATLRNGAAFGGRDGGLH